MDTYAAGLRGDLFNRPGLKVSQVLDYKTAYGVVLSPNSTRLGKCFEGYMDSHRAEIFDMIKRKVKPIEVSKARNSLYNISALISCQVRRTLKIIKS